MKISSMLRWFGIGTNGLLCIAAALAALAGTIPAAALLALAPVALSLLALVPNSPNLVATLLASLANALLLLIGLFAVVGLGDYGISPSAVALAWTGMVLAPAVNVVLVPVWRAAAQSSNSLTPRGSD